MKKIYLFLALIFSFLSTNSFAQSCNPLTINMYDSFGDGWNGNDLTFTDSTGTIFFSTTLPTVVLDQILYVFPLDVLQLAVMVDHGKVKFLGI